MNSKFQKSAGFTLIEMLIVIIILGIIAMIVVPQISVSTQDAKLETLKTNLKTLRKVIENYYFTHNNTYPGRNDTSGTPTTSVPASSTAFRLQLIRYTDVNGEVRDVADVNHQILPYFKYDLPVNPFNELNTVICNPSTDITERSSDGSCRRRRLEPLNGAAEPPPNPHSPLCSDVISRRTCRSSRTRSTGWKFYPRTGVLIANDGGHDDL